ncbi:MAG: hypothetical protein PGN09_09590 [Sphingomonas fennica]
MPAFDPKAMSATVAARTADLDKAGADLAQARSRLSALAEERAQAVAGGRAGDVAAADRRIAAAISERDRLTEAATQMADRWRGELATLLPDPCDASPAVPLLLLPVRIETRFATVARKTVLRVRIYPDAAHLDQLRRTLTPEERAAGDRHWAAQGGRRGQTAEAAYRDLVEAVGQRRAPWVAAQTDPKRSGRAAAPPVAERGAVARLLPDRFVVEVVQAGRTIRVTGNAIGPDPVMGLFGDADDAAHLVLKNGIPLAPGAEWIVDYAAAEKIGLAVTVTLPARATVDRVMVYGTRASRGPAETAADVAALFEAHRYAGELAVLPVGTPTNNLDDARSGYTPAPPAAVAARDAALPAAGDGARLAAALGVDPASFAGVAGAARQSEDAARAANIAFWWPTWGTVLDLVNTEAANVDVQVGDAELEQVRRFHRDMVRGRGPLPSLRIGRQPYGVLPVGQPDRIAFPDRVRRGIQQMTTAARGQWRAALAGVPRIGAGDPGETMRELLGMGPVSFGLRARAALAGHALNAAGPVRTEEGLEDVLNQLAWQQISQASLQWPIGSVAAKALPVWLPYAHDSDGAALATLAAGGGVAEPKSVLQAFAVLAVQEARRRRAASPIELLDTVAGRIADVAVTRGTARPTAAEVTQAASRGSEAVLALADRARDPAYARSTIAAYQPETAGQASFATMAQASRNSAAVREFALQALPEIVLAAGIETQVKEALGRLAQPDLSLDDRRILVGEALDIASHRLDAWLTGLVESRRRELRGKTPAGLQVGAFGWVEDVRPATAKDAAELGFVHAPSMAHAATAGVLRAAYLAHAREEDGGGFAIDLSSRRARLAMDLLAARREGQTLGQAFGYRIERMMQEAKLGQYIMGLRSRYPARAGQLTDAGQPIDPATQAAVAAGSLVDGVRFVDEVKAKGAAFVATQIGRKPADDRYLQGVTWRDLDAADNKPARAAFLDIAGWALKALDAAADLMLAEAVHQMTQGNAPRAAAAMDAVKGDAPAPEPTVLGTAPPTGALVHRLMLVLGAGAGWPGFRQRAAAAPALEAWAAARLGPPDAIVAGTDTAGKPVTLAGAGLCALDLVHEAADARDLFARLKVRLKLAEAVPPDAAQPGWPAGARALGEAIDLADALRRTLAEARPATPADLAAPFGTPGRVADVTDPYQFLSNARGYLGGAISTIESADATAAKRTAAVARLGEYGIRAVPGAPPRAAFAAPLAEAKARLEAANAALGQVPQTIETVTAAAAALFGPGFRIVVPLAAVAGDGWVAAEAAAKPVAKPAQLRRWLSDMGSVRPAIARHLDLMMMAEAFGHRPSLGLAQFQTPDTPPVTRFAGDGDPGDVVATCVIDRSGIVAAGAPVAALVIDEFVEPIVDRDQRTSGIAFNAPAPNARPPQTMLLAVAPDDQRWTTDRLSATLVDTIELAKLRGVTLERQLATPRLLPAIYAQSWSLQGEPVLNLAAVAGVQFPFEMAFVKDSA